MVCSPHAPFRPCDCQLQPVRAPDSSQISLSFPSRWLLRVAFGFAQGRDGSQEGGGSWHPVTLPLEHKYQAPCLHAGQTVKDPPSFPSPPWGQETSVESVSQVSSSLCLILLPSLPSRVDPQGMPSKPLAHKSQNLRIGFPENSASDK